MVGTSRAVLLKPTTPLSAAGIRIDPPVSDPKPINAAPVATDTPAPEEEPPGTRGTPGRTPNRASHAAGVPKCGFTPTPEKANSTMFVRPMMDAPALRNRATATLSCAAGGASAKTVDPAAVVCPAISKRSLTDAASPAKGRCDASACSAVVPAASNMVRTKLCLLHGARAADAHNSSSEAAVVLPSRRRLRVAIRSESTGVLKSLGFADSDIAV